MSTILDPLTMVEQLCASAAPAAVCLCRPPHVPKAKPGPCRKIKDVVGGPGKAIKRATQAAPKPKAARPKVAHPSVRGRDVRGELDYTKLAGLATSGPQGNQRMASIGRLQGFDGHPLHNDDAFDAAIARGGRRLFRGTDARPGRSGLERQQEFASGAPEYGTGLYGGGFYFSNDRGIADSYGELDAGVPKPGTVGEYVLPKTAHTIAYGALLRRMASDTTQGQDLIGQAQAQLMDDLRAAGSSGDPAIRRRVAWESFEAKVRRVGTDRDRMLADPGLYAMANGYDAIIVPVVSGLEEIVVLNRGAMVGRARADAVAAAPPPQALTSRQEKVQAAVSAALPELATHKTHTLPGGGWDAGRDAIHREIAESLYARAATVPNQGKGIIAGGLGGSGKTTVLRSHADVDPSQYLMINADDMKEELARRGLIPVIPGAEELSPMERVALVHEESQRIAQLLANKAYHDGKNVIWDITMSSQAAVQSRIDVLRQFGYTDVRGVFVDIPTEVSVSRALNRHEQGLREWLAGRGLGGRFVPPAIIRKQQTSQGRTVNREAFDTLKPQFDRWSVFDNSVDGRAPKLVQEG